MSTPTDVMDKLKWIESNACIYNISYCNAGVGIQFFEEKRVNRGSREDRIHYGEGLVCYEYHPTFADAINAEYDRLNK